LDASVFVAYSRNVIADLNLDDRVVGRHWRRVQCWGPLPLSQLQDLWRYLEANLHLLNQHLVIYTTKDSLEHRRAAKGAHQLVVIVVFLRLGSKI